MNALEPIDAMDVTGRAKSRTLPRRLVAPRAARVGPA